MIIYDGVDLGELMFIRDIQRPIMPGQTLELVDVEGRHGVLFMYKKHEPVTLPVQVVISEESIDQLHVRRHEIAAALHKHEPKRLTFSDEPGKYIEAILTGESPLNTLATHGEATLEFFCPEPFWYATPDCVHEFQGEGTHDFNRVGTIESEPEIVITGTVNGEITLDLNGQVMTYTGRLSTGEKLVIDSKWKTAYVTNAANERTSAINNLSTLDFPLARPGLNNFSVTGSVDTITVSCRSRWL